MSLSPLAARSFAALFEARTGQALAGGRRWRLDVALAPVARAHGLDGLEALAVRMAAEPALRDAVVEALLNHETSFFRDRAVFDHLRDQVLPHLAALRQATRRLRIWSAGCATGQETHSLAMLLAADAARWDGWGLDLLGTDVSAAAVRRAQEGRYLPLEVQRGLSVRELIRFFDGDGDAWTVRPELAARTRFETASLLDPAPAGRFDLILCRNVLLYFDEARRCRALDGLAAALAPGGLLLLGAGETVLGRGPLRPHPRLRGCYLADDAGAGAAAA